MVWELTWQKLLTSSLVKTKIFNKVTIGFRESPVYDYTTLRLSWKPGEVQDHLTFYEDNLKLFYTEKKMRTLSYFCNFPIKGVNARNLSSSCSFVSVITKGWARSLARGAALDSDLNSPAEYTQHNKKNAWSHTKLHIRVPRNVRHKREQEPPPEHFILSREAEPQYL